MVKKVNLLLLLLITVTSVWSQTGTIKGTIKDQTTGEPLIGATVLIGQGVGTVTDFDGMFSIRAKAQDTILFSFIGFESQEVLVGDRNIINITLAENTAELEEVVVVGYGTQKRSDVTGSVASVPEELLENLPVTDVTQAIQGTTAGLNITQGSSVPGSSGSIQVRGVNSINGSISPFIVLDGIPFTGTINDINVRDIKSIQVLKDASEVAIYGTRGSNGVILIQTKRGVDGAPNGSYPYCRSARALPAYIYLLLIVSTARLRQY